MRTTIRIDDALYRRAKAKSAESGRTVSELIEDAVRAALDKKRQTKSSIAPLPVHGGSGVLPGVDLADSSALRERMDDGEALGALR